MRVKCEKCGAEIGAENINIQEMTAVCSKCNNVFKINNIAEEKEKIDYELPKGVEIREEFGELIIERKWYTVAAFLLVFFCIIWDVPIFIVTGTVLYDKQLIGLLSLTIPLVVGISITYLCIALFINKTKIRVSRFDVDITVYPIPFGKRKVFDRRNFKQFYTKENRRYSKRTVSISYDLYGIDKNGKRIELLVGMHSLEQVKYIEQQIEKYLNIDDEYVAEEKR